MFCDCQTLLICQFLPQKIVRYAPPKSQNCPIAAPKKSLHPGAIFSCVIRAILLVTLVLKLHTFQKHSNFQEHCAKSRDSEQQPSSSFFVKTKWLSETSTKNMSVRISYQLNFFSIFMCNINRMLNVNSRNQRYLMRGCG